MTTTSTRLPVKFDRPPVVEVVFSAKFRLDSPMKSAHAGLYWNLIRAEFPNTEDAAPVNPVVDTLNGEMTIEMQFVQLPPLRRTWFLSADGRHLLQLQEDRFIYNWKRIDSGDEYPSYEKVFAGFNDQFEKFCRFLESQALGRPTVNQLELTYVNHIQTESLVGGPSSVFIVHKPAGVKGRFLPQPQGFKWATGYELPERQGGLHVVCQSAKVTGTGSPILRMDLTARGLPSDASREGCCQWFDLAHEWITQGFADLTDPQMHATWQRRQ